MNMELQRARQRQMFIFLLVCVSMLALLGRLYFWQVIQAGTLTKLANDEHIQNQTVNAPRGLIYDANGHILATNVVRDDVYIEPIQFTVDHPDADQGQLQLLQIVHTLHQVLPTVNEDQLYKDFNSGKPTMRIAGPISPAQSQQLQQLHLPDTFLEPRTLRVYPGGTLAAQVLGYVQDGSGGVYGVEAAYNQLLAGKSGSLTAETDLNGNPLTVGVSSGLAATSGANLTLTIDSNVQQMVQNALEERVKSSHAQGGTVVVLDVRSGAVLAMAGTPSFDPNHYADYYKSMGCLHSESVYFNPALQCGYEPGSTMKSITMAAALDQGLITPGLTFDDPGYRTFSDAATVTNWANIGYGQESMTGVLEHSANVGAAYVAHDILKADRYYPYLQRFGFGQPTHVGSPEEIGTYRTNASAGWTPSDLTRQAFGQSITATPLQMAVAYAAIANGGVMMRPYLVQEINNNGQIQRTQPQVVRRVISTHASQELTGMLVNTATYNAQATFPGYSVAVKTGTATTQGISDEQTEASMAGFLPASHPRYAILVKIDRPQGGDNIFGGIAAAPLWKYIGQQLVWYYGVPSDQK